MNAFWICTVPFLGLALSGCDKGGESNAGHSPEVEKLLRPPQELVELAESVPEIARATPGLVKALYAALQELHAFVAEDDYERAKVAAATIDRVIKSRIISWYVRILAKEESGGAPAALSLVDELRETEDISPTEREALDHFTTFLSKKGDIKSLDILLLISAAILEDRFGKGAGAALLALQYPVRPDDMSSVVLKKLLEGELTDDTGERTHPEERSK